MSIFTIIGLYLLAGAVALGIFDLTTKRIRARLSAASQETQTRLLTSGSYVGERTATFLLIGAMWLFWPAVFIGALTNAKEKDSDT